ncbi:MAG: fumarylacetoacetate hydrolase family protein [Saprospiraceae bacterium]|nr:fumarylacetoacetate hydrolase family protein [Saprospiraceae bacterium]
MKIFCIGRNYVEHIRELNNVATGKPLVFMKPPTALLLENKPLYYPEFTKNLHHEVEIVLRISKNGKAIQPQFAQRYYDKIALGIDFTARDVQDDLKAKGHPWELAKGFDGSAVLSSFVDLKNFDATKIAFSLTKNGETVQAGTTQEMIFSFNALVGFLSNYFTLQQGDLIYTGTPAGVGAVKVGDRLEGFLEGQSMFVCEIK